MVVDNNLLDQLLNNVPSNVDLTRFVRLIPNPAEWALKDILPEVEILGVKYKTSTFSRTISAAKFRAYDAQTPYARRAATLTVNEGLLPPLGAKTNVGEFETILLAIQRGADSSELVDAIYDLGQSHALAIRARLELARGDLLTDFKFSLAAENGLTLDADFVAPTGHLPTAATLWTTTATSTPLSDELAWVQRFRDDARGVLPNRRLTSHRVVALLQANNEYRQQAYPGRDLTTVPTTLTPGEVQIVRDRWALPPIQEYDVQIDVDGVLTRPIPDNKFLMWADGGGNASSPSDGAATTSSGSLGQTQFGTTAEGLALAGAGNPRIDKRDAPGIVGTRWVADDPVTVWVRANAVAMPLLGDTYRLLTATVA
jgi:hypothetical protein